MTKQELLERVERGRQADAILESPLATGAFEFLTRNVLDEFAATKPTDMDALQVVRIKLDVVAAFKGRFRELSQDGKNAAAELRDLERREKLSQLNKGA
jgi:hypothetical protein